MEIGNSCLAADAESLAVVLMFELVSWARMLLQLTLGDALCSCMMGWGAVPPLSGSHKQYL